MTYKIRIQHLDNKWYRPGKLEHYDSATRRFVEPTFKTRADALKVIAEIYGDCIPGTVKVVKDAVQAREARIQKMAEVARQHPDWSLRRIEEHLNLKPRCNASIFKRGTREHTAELADYQARLASWKERNQ